MSPDGLSVRTDRQLPSGDSRGLLTSERLAKALTGRSAPGPVVAEAGAAASEVEAIALPERAHANSAIAANLRADIRPSPWLPTPSITQTSLRGAGRLSGRRILPVRCPASIFTSSFRGPGRLSRAREPGIQAL